MVANKGLTFWYEIDEVLKARGHSGATPDEFGAVNYFEFIDAVNAAEYIVGWRERIRDKMRSFMFEQIAQDSGSKDAPADLAAVARAEAFEECARLCDRLAAWSRNLGDNKNSTSLAWAAAAESLAGQIRLQALVSSSPAPVADLCEDEGCPHHGTPHVCTTHSPAPAAPGVWMDAQVKAACRVLAQHETSKLPLVDIARAALEAASGKRP